ncbi:MAG: NUDIX domain-containing protein [Betaproteobacteria bacterium]
MSSIACVPAEIAEVFIPFDVKCAAEIVFIDRSVAETDPSHRQIIPYVAVRRSRDGKFLVYDRAGSEQRLHGLSSIGIGGHVDHPETWQDALYREMREEAGITIYHKWHLGKILLSDSLVNQVHMGLCFLVETQDAWPGEELQNARWLSLSDIKNLTLEAWSIELIDMVERFERKRAKA